MEHHFDQRLPHSGSGLNRRAGGGFYPGQRHRLRRSGAGKGPRRGRIRSAPVVFPERAQRSAGRDRQISRRPALVGANHARAVQSPRSALVDVPLSHANRRLDAHRPATEREHRARDAPGAGGGAGRNAIAAYQCSRRSTGPAHGGFRAARAAHPADSGRRKRRRQHRGSPRRLVRHREAYR